ncbi:hypothetical protein M0R45_006353 [Rubus argutus]|uniref:Uncharacterized protein n=1 Tax=Rubus argutus TaxID=59490 RepID=A0AAW1YQV6_RUBAR
MWVLASHLGFDGMDAVMGAFKSELGSCGVAAAVRSKSGGDARLGRARQWQQGYVNGGRAVMVMDAMVICDGEALDCRCVFGLGRGLEEWA